MDFEKVLATRRSIRKFLKKEIPKPKLKKILEAALLAPSAGNLQAFEIFLVSDNQRKEALAKAAYNQDFLKEAPIILVFFANPLRSALKYGERGANFYCLNDAILAAFSAWLEAVNLNLAGAWVGGFKEEEVKKIFSCPDLIPVVLMPLGYPGEKGKKFPRRTLEDVLH